MDKNVDAWLTQLETAQAGQAEILAVFQDDAGLWGIGLDGPKLLPADYPLRRKVYHVISPNDWKDANEP